MTSQKMKEQNFSTNNTKSLFNIAKYTQNLIQLHIEYTVYSNVRFYLNKDHTLQAEVSQISTNIEHSHE